jgi:hypothetical protein
MYGPRALFRLRRMGRRTSLSSRCGHGTSDTPDVSEGRVSLRANNGAHLRGKLRNVNIRQLTYDKRRDRLYGP